MATYTTRLLVNWVVFPLFSGFQYKVSLIREDDTELPITKQYVIFNTIEEADFWVLVNTEPIFFDVATTDLAPPDNKVKYVGIYAFNYYVFGDAEFLVLKIELPRPKTYLAGEQIIIPPNALRVRVHKVVL